MEKYYKWKNGKKVAMSSREVKQFIMEQNGWTAETYRKQYDIFKNKLNAYESYQRSRGVAVEHQSTTALLFKEAKSKKTYGNDYKPSMKMQQIKSFSAYSITKGRQLAQGESASARRYQAKETAKYEAYVQRRFGGLIESNPKAQEINELIKDPVKKEKALSELANKLNAKITDDEVKEAGEAIPISTEHYGSSDEIDFDISEYLDN